MGFVADLHAAAARMVPEAEIVAVASPTPGKAAHFARERGIPHAFEDYGELLRLKDVQLVTLALPNQRAKQMADGERWVGSSWSSRARNTLGRTRRGSGM